MGIFSVLKNRFSRDKAFEERIEVLMRLPGINCHQRFHRDVGINLDESMEIHLIRLMQHGYSSRSEHKNCGRVDFMKMLSGSPEENCHHTCVSGISLSQKEAQVIHEHRLKRFGHSKYESKADVTKREERIENLLSDPDINCHHGWHGSVNLTEQDSLSIHKKRLQKYNRSFFSSEYRTISQKEDEKERERQSLMRDKKFVSRANNWKEKNVLVVTKYLNGLIKEIEALTETDSYGIDDFSKWECIEVDEIEECLLAEIIEGNQYQYFKSGLPYFFERVLLKEMDGAHKWIENWQLFKGVIENGAWKNSTWRGFISSIIRKQYELYERGSKRTSHGPKYSENMPGFEYEIYCMKLLQEAGWHVEQTKASNDQGVDLIAKIENLKVCIQCKRYSNPVGNKAVQEIIAGKTFYDGTHAVVVSNAEFTKAAKALAESAGVILVNDTELEDLENMI